MKTEIELNEMIIGIKNLITTKYPELQKFLDEMPITIPTEDSPEINIEILSSYYNSLYDMVEDYKDNKSKFVKQNKQINL